MRLVWTRIKGAARAIEARPKPRSIVRLKSGQKLKSRGNQVIPEGDRLIVEMPGGGGLGNATERDPALVADDLRSGFISKESARKVYKVAVREDGSVDAEGTKELRGQS